MFTREELISAVGDEENARLFEIVAAHNGSDPFDLGELLSTLDRSQLEGVWRELQVKGTTALLGLNFESQEGEDEEQQQQDLEQVLKLVQVVTTIAIETASLENVNVPDSLFETAVVFHGILLTIPEDYDKLKNSLCGLFELWWRVGLPRRGDLVAQTLLYLLMRSLEDKPLVKDIKRVWQMRESLEMIDLSNQSSQTLRLLLQHCMVSPVYLKSEQGRKFLSFVFGLNEEFVTVLHHVVKAQIPTTSKSNLAHYGEIYFNAWRNASDGILIKLEESCIQDLMYSAILGKKPVAANIREVLLYIHKHKTHPGVDEMLCRLYEPILWRHLKVANGLVRANAATLLIDAFPLHNPKASTQENDELLQKQFDLLDYFLKDPCVMLRIIAVQGVCQIHNVYWEMIPAATIKDFLCKLCREMVFDASSPDVRTAVLKGLTALLDNHLSHSVLKTLLPELKLFLHDTSERVRVAFMDLLLKVKGLRTIKYWNIVPPDELLARLEVDSGCIVKRIVSLLFNSFMPVEKSSNEQLERCIVMLRQNAAAARPFYHYAARNHLTVAQSVKFMVSICKLILVSIKKERDSQRRSGNGNQRDFLESSDEEEEDNDGQEKNASHDGTDRQNGGEAAANESADKDTQGEVSMKDTDLMCHLLEIVILLWTTVAEDIKEDRYTEVREMLAQRYSVALPIYVRSFDDTRITSNLLLLAGFLPAESIPTISRSILSKLKHLDPDSTVESYSSMLECMCNWGKVPDLMELISDWLQPVLSLQDENNVSVNKSARRRAVAFQETSDPQPELALKFLTRLCQDFQCREALLGKRGPVTAVVKVLKTVMKCAEKRFVSSEQISEAASDDFLLRGFEMYLKLEGILHKPENKHNALTTLEDTIVWADCEILPLFKKKRAAGGVARKRARKLMATADATLLSDGDGSQTLAGQSLGVTGVTLSDTLLSETVLGKRAAGDENTANILSMASRMLETILHVASNLLLVGVGNHRLASHLADFAIAVLQLEESTKFLPLIATLMYQITEFTLSLEDAEELDQDYPQSPAGDGGRDHVVPGNVVPRMLGKVIEMLTALVKNKREQAERILPSVRSAFTEVLSTYYRHLSLNHSVNRDIIAAVTTACVTEVTETLAKDLEFEACDSVADLPTLTSFFLSMLIRRKDMISLFLQELCSSIESESGGKQTTLVAATHIVHTITKAGSGRYEVSDVKDCLNSLQSQSEKVSLPTDIPEEAPERHFAERNRKLLKDCMTRIGMVQ